MLRVTAEWSGFRGAPGYSNFYFDGPGPETPAIAQANAESVRAFFEAVRGSFPLALRIQIQPLVARINPATGELEDEIPLTTPLVVVSGSGNIVGSVVSGVCVNWRTSTIVDGRRVRGRTFLIPLQGGAYESDGTPSAGALAEFRAAATALATVNVGSPSELVIWKRPINREGGSTATVTSAQVSDKPAILRSRRD